MFQFAGFASPSYGFTRRYRTCAVGCPIRRSEDHRALAPPLGFSQRATSFIASRCQGIHQMPLSCVARAQPRARGQAARRDRMSEVRGQMASRPATRPTPRCSDLRSPNSDLWDRCASTAPPLLAQRHFAYPCPGPTSPRRAMTGPASRSRLASRCPENKGRRSEDRPSGPAAPFSVTTRGSRCQKTDFKETSDLCPLSSEPGGPGPI
jgi:hypothetical protein